MLSHNYILSSVDHSLFLKHHGTNITALLLYVEYIVLTENDVEEINHVTHLLDQNFKFKNLGDHTSFLGFEVAHNKTKLHLSQRKYTLDLLNETRMLDYAPMPTPTVHYSRPSTNKGIKLIEDKSTTYRRLIGHLIYLTNMRSDITFGVNNLSQFVSAPTKDHQQAACRILRYLKNALGYGLFFQNKKCIKLKAYSDFDWATCFETRKSITGFSIYLG